MMSALQLLTTGQLIVAFLGIFAISFVFSIFGRGGGEFKLPLLLSIVPLPFGELKLISVFLILVQGVVMLLVYSKRHRLIDWPVAIVLAVVVGASSFTGGYFSHLVPPIYLKGLFAAILLISAGKLALGTGQSAGRARFGVWHRHLSDSQRTEYDVNVVYLLVPVALVGGIAGMLGVSGCGLIIPLCVVLGGMPLRIAIGTNTLLLISSTASSFLGHLLTTPFHWEIGLLLAGAAIPGAFLGSRQHTTISDRNIKRGFIAILIIAALWMIYKMFK